MLRLLCACFAWKSLLFTCLPAPPQALEEGWRNCPSDPILVTPNPGETEVDLKQYFDEPEKNEVGW